MRGGIMKALMIVVLVGLTAMASEPALDEEAADGEILIYPVRGTPATELVATLRELFSESEVRPTVEPNGELLLMRVAPEVRPRLVKLLEHIDRPARMLLIQTQLLKLREGAARDLDVARFSGSTDEVAKHIQTLEQEGVLYVANRMEVTAVENQRSLLQIGETVSVVAGAAFTAGRNLTRSYRNQQVGTVLSVLAKAADDGGISISLEFEKSELAATPSTEGDEVVPPNTSMLTHHATLHVRDGQSVLVGTLLDRSGSQTSEAYLVVSAKIIQGSDDRATFRSLSQQPNAALNRSLPRGFPGSRDSASAAFREELDGRYVRYFESLVEKYDTNRDGALDQDERANLTQDYSAADQDQDGLVSASELARWALARWTRGRPQERE